MEIQSEGRIEIDTVLERNSKRKENWSNGEEVREKLHNGFIIFTLYLILVLVIKSRKMR
jgi:hypothetical protein